MERESVSPRTLLKYLKNTLENPHEVKFRQIRIANKLFWNQVWITACRGVLHILGFEEHGPFIEMGPNGMLPASRIQQLSKTISDLEVILPYIENYSSIHNQPPGTDGVGRAGYHNIGIHTRSNFA